MRNKAIALGIAVMLLILVAVPLTSMAMTRRAYVSTSNGGNLNMRIYPTTDSDVITSIPYGGEVTILASYDDGLWVDVAYGSYEGYVMWRYLVYEYPGPMPGPIPRPDPTFNPVPNPMPNPTARPTAKPNPNPSNNSVEKALANLFNGFEQMRYLAAVKPSTPGGIVHMRWAPSKATAIITDYHQNDQLQVLAQNDSWCQVRDPGTGVTGFMMRSFLTLISIGDGIGSDDSGS